MKLRPSTIAVAAALLLSGCSVLQSDNTPNYRNNTAKTRPLEVPPDLSQLARDSRFQPQGGVVSASSALRPGDNVPGAAATPAVAVPAQGEVRVERQGQTRWLVVPQTPEQLWPKLKTFWEQNGFTLMSENASAGVMETNWNENRAKLPADVVRNAVAAALGRVFDTGERDQYRTRVERAATGGSEIFISHRGVQEVYANDQRDGTIWRARPSDPQLEIEFLSRLMTTLGGKTETARAAVADAPEVATKARVLNGQPSAALELDEPFDRAWRRVGLALDRSGFSVEDRDRAGGLYYVRYIDPKLAGQEEPGFFARLFSKAPAGGQGPVRYRVALKPAATGVERTTISILSSAGAPESGEDAQRIVGLLVDELR
jgi:outer membrane protein assembly factor BamC